jgi:hypothetical protein
MERHRKIDDILVYTRGHSSILDVQLFGAADCDTDHYLVVAKLGSDWQWVNKQRTGFIWRGSISRY